MRKLVWVDKRINNEENQQYQTRLLKIINECSFFDSINDALQIVPNQQEGDKIVVMISSSLIEECLQKPLNNNLIVFCRSVRKHFSMFLNKYELLVIIDSGIQHVEKYVKSNLDFLEAQQSLTLQFIQQSSNEIMYNHQLQEISIRFLMINQKLQENFADQEELLNSEIVQLIPQNLLQTFQESVILQETLKYEKTGEIFTNFEKLIYYYTREDQSVNFYKKLNQKLSQSNYEGLEQIMCTLFYGYQNLNYLSLSVSLLYRGISFTEPDKIIYDQIVKELTECKEQSKSIFWNSLTSTSTNQSSTNFFLKSKYKILFEIQLDQNNPHPYFKLEEYHSQFPREGEVILFPQFEFQVIEMDQIGSNNYYHIKVKQAQNNFSMALNKTKRKEYWEQRIETDLKPKLKIMASFYQIRINFIMKNIRNKEFKLCSRCIKDSLKENSDNYFLKLVTQLQKFCDNQKGHENQLSQLLLVIKEEISFETEITDEFLEESKILFKNSSDRLIKEFILIIKKIYNLEVFKNDIRHIVQERIEVAEKKRKKNEKKEDIYEILVLSKDFDEYLFDILIKMFKKGKITNCIGFLSKNNKKKYFEQYFSDLNYSQQMNKEEKMKNIKENLSLMTHVLQNILDIQFNKWNYSTEVSKEIRQDLITKISNDKKIIQFLKFIVRLTAYDDQFIQCGSNSLNLLVEMKVNLREQSFEDIRIQETTLIGANLAKCNLSGSKFDNVDISGMNVNGAQLFNCCWKKLKIHEFNEFLGHTSYILSICFSSDSTIIAFGSYDKSIRLWNIKTGQQILKLDGHTSTVYSVCFSCDGKLASGSEDQSVRLWNIETGYQQQKMDGHNSIVQSVCFSHDGTTLASGSNDKTIRLWDVNTGQQKSIFVGHQNSVYSVCFSHDGKLLASGSADNSIRLWDINTKQQTAIFVGHSNSVYSVCFSSDSKALASGSADKSIRLWEVDTRQQTAKFDGHSNSVYSVCFSPDSKVLASGSADKSIRIWEVDTRQQTAKFDGHTNYVLSICFSPDGTILASCSNDKSIRLWDQKGQKITKFDGHTSYVLSICFSPDGTTLASGSDDKSIHLWDIKTGKQKAKLDEHTSTVFSISFSPDGTQLASCSNDKSICLWDCITGQLQTKLTGHTSNIHSVCFSPYGTTLVSGSEDQSVRLWSIQTNQQILKMDGHNSAVYSVCFSPDGATLASGSDDNSIRLWDVNTGQSKFNLHGHTSGVLSVCFSPNGSLLASGGNDNSVRLWNVKTGEQQKKLNGHTSYVQSVCFSSDSTTLASGSYDNSIRLWNVNTGQQQAILDGHTSYVSQICFSPNGTLLASASYDNTIRLWDIRTQYQKQKLFDHTSSVLTASLSTDYTTLASGSDNNSIRVQNVNTGYQQAILDGHASYVSQVCFSPNGTLLASASYDNTIRLWDIQTGQQQTQLDGHTSTIYSVCFSFDGTTLASSSGDLSIRIWNVQTGQQKAKLNLNQDQVGQLCFSLDGTVLASRLVDNSICLWDVRTASQIQTSNHRQKAILAQFSTPIFQNNFLPQIATANITVLLISQSQQFQAQGTLILKGEFSNYRGIDLQQYFQSKGSCILENYIQIQHLQS